MIAPRQFQTPAPLLERRRVRPGQHLKEPAWDHVAEVRRVASPQDAGLGRRGPILQDHREGGRLGGTNQPAIDLALILPQIHRRRRREERLNVDDRLIRHLARGSRPIEHAADRLGVGVGQSFGRGHAVAPGAFQGLLPTVDHLPEQRAVTLRDLLRAFRRLGEGAGHQRIERFWREIAQCPAHLLRPVREGLTRQASERVPRPKNRIISLPGAGQGVAPAADRRGDQVRLGEDLIERLLGVLLQLELGQEVLRHPLAHAARGGGPRLGHLLMQGGLSFAQAHLERTLRIRSILVGDRGDEPLGAVAEDAVESVVIGRGDRVVFMIVAAGARDRQPERAARDHVNPIVDDVVRHPEEPPTEGQEPHRGQIGRVVGRLVGRDLQEQEPVVRHVLVERATTQSR